MDRERALRELVVLGGVLNGLPPATEEEWAIAAELYEPEVLERLHRWRPADGFFGEPSPARTAMLEAMGLIQRDAGDVPEPLLRRDRGADQHDVPGFLEHEHGRVTDF
jgi:hypothetical protein